METKRTTKDIPLNEITLRKYESPKGLDKRELCHKFLLSLGLLQPGESRDILIDIFYLFVQNKTKEPIDVLFISKKLKDKPGASEPNIRRQIRRLKEFKLVDKVGIAYKLADSENAVKNFLIPFYIQPSTERLLDYARELSK